MSLIWYSRRQQCFCISGQVFIFVSLPFWFPIKYGPRGHVNDARGTRFDSSPSRVTLNEPARSGMINCPTFWDLIFRLGETTTHAHERTICDAAKRAKTFMPYYCLIRFYFYFLLRSFFFLRFVPVVSTTQYLSVTAHDRAEIRFARSSPKRNNDLFHFRKRVVVTRRLSRLVSFLTFCSFSGLSREVNFGTYDTLN